MTAPRLHSSATCSLVSGPKDSGVRAAVVLQVADREVEHFEGGLLGGELAAVAGDLCAAWRSSRRCAAGAVRAQLRAVAEGGELRLVIPSTAVLRVFAVTGGDAGHRVGQLREPACPRPGVRSCRGP